MSMSCKTARRRRRRDSRGQHWALPENNDAYAEPTIVYMLICTEISDWRALTWLATETGWARSKRSAIFSGKLISG